MKLFQLLSVLLHALTYLWENEYHSSIEFQVFYWHC